MRELRKNIFFMQNIFTTGTLHAIVYKSQAMRLPGIVVRILPQDQHLDLT